MSTGQVLQVGSPQEVCARLATAEGAQLVDIETVVPGHVVANEKGLATVLVNGTTLKGLGADMSGSAVYVCIRVEVEDVLLEQAGSGALRARSPVWPGDQRRPHDVVMTVTVDCGVPLRAGIPRGARVARGLETGAVVAAAIKAGAVHLVPRSA